MSYQLSFDILRKVSKWTDDIKRDTKYFGVGTVSKQTFYPNGSKNDHPSEDRSFSYELKENKIYAYGIVDGYNGTFAVDLIEQCLLSELYFDHLNNLETKPDDQVFALLKDEFQKAEQTLRDNQEDLLMTRAAKTILNGELRRGTVQYLENRKEISDIDRMIEGGAFATISLIINNRLFVANVGTVHCFVCTYDKKTMQKVVSTLEFEHSVNNVAEMLRLANMHAHVDPEHIQIHYTRCLGDFKLKLYYHELPEFCECTKSPFTCEAEHPERSLQIDDSFLFMGMYSDGLVKTIENTNLITNNESVNSVIAKMLIKKIISEQTLNSAAQSVIDEIKRAFDDKNMSTYCERDDCTLVVRVFDLNVKNKLITIENQSTPHNRTDTQFIEENLIEDEDDEQYHSLQSLDSSFISTSISETNSTTNKSADRTKRENLPQQELLDKDGKVIPYIDFSKLESLVDANENRQIFDQFNQQLTQLANNSQKSSL